ncbi:unnamed protein product [Symbiodinium sp. CCMP2456]|nr:unnamed protein product [Symbiodinium sp. CCMP2456]
MGSETATVAAHKLDDVMKRRREVCAEFESHPAATTADATCEIKNGYSWNPDTSDLTQKSAEFESHPAATTADATCAIKNGYSWNPDTSDLTQKRHPTSDTQLQSLLSERRGRCHVLESSPAPVIADALWNRAPAPLQAYQHCRTTTTEHATGLRSEEHQQSLDATPSMPSRNYGMERPLELKWSSWLDVLQVAGSSHGPDQSEKASAATARLLQLMSWHDDTLTTSLRRILAEAFVSKHLSFLSFEQDHLDAVIVILLRYHSPAMLPRLVGPVPSTEAEGGESTMGLLDQVAASPVLDLLLGRACASGLDCEDASAALALLHICDETVRSGSEIILVFVILAVLASPDLSFSDSKSESAVQLWSSAESFLASTPRSMLGILAAGARDQALRLPVGSVAADEVLHHVYERPDSQWRLVVVDIRDSSLASLPVCLRLPAASNFEEFAASLPAEHALHCCIIADDPLEALKLCLHISGPSGACRPHISLAEGGWRAVEELALALGLELLPGVRECTEMDEAGNAHGIAGTVVEVAEHVASLTSVAASVAFRGAFWAAGVHATKHGEEIYTDELMEV